MKKLLGILGNLCVLVLLVFSIVELVKSLGSWTILDDLWAIAVILLIIGFIGDLLQAKKMKQSKNSEHM
ncbi:hypothetical protein GCM10011391_08700 [Pullulanibacillus camelliae]|uniref:Uncharacterized protein n=1 Tax=Pullulanibacillus camelliae TaxID=1707096 RepID=A0A8J2YFX8_9BACL|nr:hypothetical protein [Pullulanibacillus camelliae]GGE32298.1 hypothetical protein GCM10011391_08700 [Pullulanibacillus camelliae]